MSKQVAAVTECRSKNFFLSGLSFCARKLATSHCFLRVACILQDVKISLCLEAKTAAPALTVRNIKAPNFNSC